MQYIDNSIEIKEALETSEEKYRHLTRLMPVAVFSTDQDGVITFYNEKAAELWGRSPRLGDPDEIRFCGSLKLFQPDGTPMTHEECPMGKALKYKKSFRNEEIMIERPDGKRVIALVNIDPLFGNDGQLTGAINVLQDITERKKTQLSTMRLAAIVESSEDAIISKTLSGIITSWNNAAERIFGYTDKEIVGKPIYVLIPASHQEEEKVILEKIGKGERIEHFETIRLNKYGQEINISLTVSPIKNERGEIIGASKISRDITEKVRTEEQLRIYTQKLKELNNHKDEFLAMASHELKTPLTVIKANIGLLQLKLNDDFSQEFVTRTMVQVNKLSDLISDLLDISKVQSGNLQLNFTSFDFKKLIYETVENIEHTHPSHKIIFDTVNDKLPIVADMARLEQVIINVITNAIKYSPASDKVVLSAEYHVDFITVSVKDFGIGISKENLKKVFSRFFMVKETIPKILGSGIELYISNEIIKRHKGKMWVESEENNGSTFYFSIPTLQ
ncbi:MAG: PAS domain S-box protein [Ginsengibacter sp.]